MGGQDESRARAVLVEMQDRLAGGPYSALGIGPSATASEIRTAFLELTKTYHPARFGYMSSELQKLSNEVFLALRAAHDAIAKPTRAPANRNDRPSAPGKERSGVFPSGAAANKNDRSGVLPRVAPGAGPKTDRSGVFPAVAAPGASRATAPVTQPTATAPIPPRTPTPESGRPAAGRAATPLGVRVGTVRGPAAPAVQPLARPPTRTPSAPTTTVNAAPAPARDERELASVLDLMQRGQWDAARSALAALTARAPDSPRYRALAVYAKGREAQLAHRLDEARVELQDALQIDPELQLAKTALAELFTRRK